jgi:Alpha/beta hydrolase family
MTFVLVPSPFLGPSSWRAVAEVLGDRSRACHVLDLREALSAPEDVYEALAARAARQLADPSILVVHSGAGALVPTIWRRAAGLARGAIFVDALLPHPGRSWFDTAPSFLVRRLRTAAAEGRAPPWPQWAPGALAEILPDPDLRAALVADAPRAPLSYLEERAPAAPGWPARRCAYLQTSAAYGGQAAEARSFGWAVGHLSGHHLSIMTQPAAVADAILGVADALQTGDEAPARGDRR